jgi:formate/nitrite transporter FocA (FNT family)
VGVPGVWPGTTAVLRVQHHNWGFRVDNQAGSDSPHLNEDEQGQAAAHAAPRALIIHEIIREEGEAGLGRTNRALAFSGFAAGLSMGFSFLTQALLHAGLPDAPWRHLIDSVGYSVGFVIVILGRQQLFTESTLTAVLPVLTRWDAATAVNALRLWGIVLATNLAATWVFASMLTIPDVFKPPVVEALHALSIGGMQSAFLATFVKALFAGWLIAMMVWLLPSARSARLALVLLVTSVVALGQLSHVIAGSVDAAYAVLCGLAPFGDYVGKFLIPTLLGNTLGGVALVAVLNHAAIAQEMLPDDIPRDR